MNAVSEKKHKSSDYSVPDWIWEVLLVVAVAPAIVAGLFSVGSIPIV